MRTRFVCTTATAAGLALALTVSAQTPPPPSQPDRPRDTMSQPDDRQKEITLNGCVQKADMTSSSPSGSTSPSGTPSTSARSDEAKYILTSASMGPATSGTAGTTGSTPSSAAAGTTYKLKGEETDLAKFVGQRVEVRGRLEDKMGSSSGTAASPSQPGSTGSARTSSDEKVLKVSSVRAASGAGPCPEGR
jgi:hypothetical protein